MSSSPDEPTPFSFAPSLSWAGNAGTWSTFVIGAGTPPQYFQVLPSTNGHQTWIPVPLGCNSTDPSNCAMLRGALPHRGISNNGFLSNQSSTWEKKGLFKLGINNPLNLTGNGDYGYDTVRLGSDGPKGINLTHQLVAGIATKDFYIGQFGLNPKTSNFSNDDHPVPGYLENLVEAKLIPSFSYGYTAGAKYRVNSVLGSLTLGGYESSRLTMSNFSIPFSSNDFRLLTVGVQSITASNTLNGDVQILPSGGYFLIDSSVPDLWLPEAACQLFQETFGLILDNATNLYVLNNSIHSRLMQLNPSVTLRIGIEDIDGPTVDIKLPYGAFDLQASSPFYPNATNYFPIRRAANNTQYTLGRTFLQEAYVIVDYERANFSVNQAVFHVNDPYTIVTIHSINYSSSKNASDDDNLGQGSIAGITVGAVAFIFTLIVILVYLIRRHRHAKQSALQDNRQNSPRELEDPQMQDRNNSSRIWINELDPKPQKPQDPQELSDNSRPPPQGARYELTGSSEVGELPSPVPSGLISPVSRTKSA